MQIFNKNSLMSFTDGYPHVTTTPSGIQTTSWQTLACGPHLAWCLFLNGQQAKNGFYIFV